MGFSTKYADTLTFIMPNEKMYFFISDNRTYHFQAEDEQEYVA